MINPSGNFRVFLAAEPVDFRKGMDGLAGYVAAHFDLDPFDGAIYVFRPRRADCLMMIAWDHRGAVAGLDHDVWSDAIFAPTAR